MSTAIATRFAEVDWVDLGRNAFEIESDSVLGREPAVSVSFEKFAVDECIAATLGIRSVSDLEEEQDDALFAARRQIREGWSEAEEVG